MGGKGKAPAPPDLSGLIAASKEQAQLFANQAAEELKWAKEQQAFNADILERVLGVQLPMMEEQLRQATLDRERYEEIYQPLEDNLVKEFSEYDTPERREQEAAAQIADTRQAFEAQRANAEAQLEGYGLDPSQYRKNALDRPLLAAEAATAAMAGNAGRKQVENLGRALRTEAINIGRGYPGQVAQTQALTNQTGQGALQGGWGNTAAGVSALQGAQAYGNMGMAGFNQAGNMMNQGYQNQLAQWNANASADAAMWQGIGQLAGAGMGAYGMINFGGGGEEGGAVPGDLSPVPGPTDTIPAMLAPDEYVIPADVVKRKGTEFFDKLLSKYKDDGEYEQKKRQAIGGVA